MYRIELHGFIGLLLQSFYRFGIWDAEATAFEFRRRMFHYVYMLSFDGSLLAGAYLSCDKSESIFLMTLGNAVFLVVFRVYKLISEQKSILTFLQDFSSHFIHDYDEFEQINKKLKTFVKLSILFFFLCFASIVINLIFPFIVRDKVLLVAIGFPLDWRNKATSFCIAYIFVLGGSVYVFFSVLISIIIWYLMFNCAIKYEILGNQLRKSGTRKIGQVQENVKKEVNPYLVDLIEAIKTHRNINRMVEEFSECFEGVFSIQIGTSQICICGSIYSLIFNSDDDNLIQYGFYCIFIAYSLFDSFVVMLLGNKIMESSDRLSYCLFESNWIEQSNECKKLIIIMTEVLKRPQEIVICKLYPLNLQTYTTTLNGAYSMFNILKNLK